MREAVSVFVGSSSLLTRCIEACRRDGHSIALVVTRSPRVAAWCRERDIAARAFSSHETIDATAFDGIAFDYLFSVGHLELLPMDLVARAQRAAVNFHDGPLPAYAGLNVTHWALLSGERQHGVTWHGIAAGADTGPIVAEARFDIADDETAFSLNAKVFDAAAQMFETVLVRLGDPFFAAAAQSGARTVFRRDNRPPAASIIDPRSTVDQVVRLIRALDAGRYWSPFSNARLIIGSRAVLVREAAVLATVATAPPGTVLACESDSIDLAVGDGVVRLGGLETPDGRPIGIDAVVAVGQPLASLTVADRSAFEIASTAAAKSEPRWIADLAQAVPFEWPYPTRVRAQEGAEDGAPHRFALATDIAAIECALQAPVGAAVCALAAAWMARLGAEGAAPITFTSAATRAAVSGVDAVFSSERPLVLDPTEADTVAAIAARASSVIAKIERRGPLAHDLAGRLGRLEAPLSGMPASAIAIHIDAGTEAPSRSLSPVRLTVDSVRGALVLEIADSFSAETARIIAVHLEHFIAAVVEAPTRPWREIDLAPPAEQAAVATINAAARTAIELVTIDRAFARQAALTPDRPAVHDRAESISYSALDARADGIAAALAGTGVVSGDLVAVALGRTVDMVATLLAILRLGAAYVPIDPHFPDERRRWIAEDCGARVVVIDRDDAAISGIGMRPLRVDRVDACAATRPASGHGADALAYIMYTSGSTGRPKGVAISHANIANFFAGMDACIPRSDGAVWLSVTSISFDISVLELLWTLTRGDTVALHAGTRAAPASKGPAFSLFYFSAAASAESGARDIYRLLLEGARFADANGFEAVWTPERHFHDFGGLYPNPSVTGAAVAAVTRNVAVRAGSCVLPLHDPIRVAEEWSVVDNLCGGRAGIAIASGWMPEDFVLMPEAFTTRHKRLLDGMATIDKLWRGEAIERVKPDGETAVVRIMPRPVQPKLPMWLTAAKNPETFRLAGETGASVLTHLLGMTRDELAGNIRVYREARRTAGHAGPGRVTLMVHTFVGEDDASVRETVRAPMKHYLASSIELVRAAAWTFPTIVAKSGASRPADFDPGTLGPDELDAVLDHAFERYYGENGLFGTPQSCRASVAELAAIGIDEFACLVDFGVATDTVLAHLPYLKQVMDAAQSGSAAASVAEDIAHHNATMLQCTPSTAAMLLADDAGRNALGRLDALLVGGEALPLDMADALVAAVRGRVFNMYGPTETTIWSSVAELSAGERFVPLGVPIANTSLHVVDAAGRECPALVPGELLIGGAGIAQGYWRRPDLTAERFVVHRRGSEIIPVYRTGDLVRRHPDGRIEFLGRVDQQVKIRGHRIELGEIEAALATDPSVARAVVVARAGLAGAELHAFVTSRTGARAEAGPLGRHLRRVLPEIMAPASITVLDRLPETPNGKIDRKALATRAAMPNAVAPHAAEPVRAAPAVVTAMPRPVAPDETERAVAELWSRLLDRPDIARTANFFELGGHSLLAIQMHRALAADFAPGLTLVDVFRYPTLAALAGRIAEVAGEQKPPATPITSGSPRSSKPVAPVADRTRTAARRSAIRRDVAKALSTAGK